MRGKKYLLLISSIFVILFLVLVLAKPLYKCLRTYLSKTEQVKANILLVEGWLPFEALKTAYLEFQENGYEYIITTGLEYSNEYFMLSMDGYLIFFLKDTFQDIGDSGKHHFEIDAYSQLGGKHSAHFNVFVNDTIIADFQAGKRKKRYNILWQGNIAEIDSIMIQFDNDAIGNWGDRNLFIKDIIINDTIKLPYQSNSVYEISAPSSQARFENNFRSYAELAKKRLLIMGIDSSKIISIQGDKFSVNRTLNSALAFRDWLKTSNIKVEGINVITVGTHARRTWMTYNKLLDKSFNIGIISIPDYYARSSEKTRVLKTLRETLGIIYYWLILIFY